MRRRTAELTGEKTRGRLYRTASKVITYVWKHTFAKLGEDWVFLAVLGIVMAIISYIMDYGIAQCGASRMMLYKIVKEQNHHIVVQFLAWCVLPIFLVLFSAGFVHLVAPQAIGSGIPEMKTIMRGVVLKVRNFSKIMFHTSTSAKTNFLYRNSLDFDVSKMWILWKMRFQKCEFCENWDFENVNFVKNWNFRKVNWDFS